MVREQELIQKKLQDAMDKFNLDAMILTDPSSVYYATGMASTLSYASGTIGMVLAVVTRIGKVALVCSEFDSQAARNCCNSIEIYSYPTWIYIADVPDDGKEKASQPDGLETFRIAADIIHDRSGKLEKVGVEWKNLPYDCMMYLKNTFGEPVIVDCSKALIEARAYKTPWEIQTLKECAQAAEKAMYLTAQQTEIGMSEEDIVHIWNKSWQMQGKMFYDQFSAFTFADQYSPHLIPRKAPKLKEGDLVRLDGGAIGNGYGSDLARTFVVGNKVAPEREKIFEVLLEAFDEIFNMIGPGVAMCDVYNKAMNIIKKEIPDYKRGHVGHSIGCARFVEEYPFLAADETRVLEPGMVFCAEVPYYSSFNSSFNLEDTFAVTENGIDRFTTVNRSLFWK